MANSTFRNFVYWTVLVFIVVLVGETSAYMAMVHDSRVGLRPNANIDSFSVKNIDSSFDFLSNRSYFHVRQMLMGDTDANQFPRCLSQPYLTYIPYPGYSRLGKQEHNLDGYRGKRIPLPRDGNYRILCMGGSTTYGSGVFRYNDSYPAQLDSILNTYFANEKDFASKYKGVEVLNAGLEAGTSAEELSQYLFKYHYYKPDLVILHTGGNDALISAASTDYQPDYTHYRRMDFNINPLPLHSRWLMKSYFWSYVIIRLFYSHIADHPFYKFEQDGTTKFCRWNTVNVDSLVQAKDYSYYAFYHNFNSLIREIKADSAKILLVPFVLNPTDKWVQETGNYRNNVALYNGMMQNAATLYGCTFLNFTSDSISYEKYGIDDCHLNATGEQLKAKMIARKVIGIINE